MAYDFIEALGKQKAITTPTNKPTGVSPTVHTAAIPQPKPQVVAKPTINNPHGKIFSGGIVSKALDLLRLPEYALASFGKGGQQAQAEQRAKKGYSTTAGVHGLSSPGDIAEKVGKGISYGFKNLIPGIINRTQWGRENGDYNAGAQLSSNPAVQSGVNLTASLGAPAVPLGKVFTTGGKIASKLPGAEKVAQTASNVGGKVLTAARNTPSVYNAVEKYVPGLEHFRNPEVGKIINKSKDVMETRVSSLYNQINDMAHGLTSAERVKIGNIIEGGITTKANNKLVVRANRIKEISDQIGKELVDSGLMSKESFAKFKGKYLSHIADVVKTEERNKLASKTLSFTSSSLKQRKNILGTAGNPDYIREFQYPTFKALGSEIQNIESTKAIKQIADKFGTKVEDTLPPNELSKELINTLKPSKKLNINVTKPFEQTLAGPRTTKEGLVHLADILPQNVGKQFKGVAVPQEVADYIARKYARSDPNLLTKVADKALSYWKLGKTIYSGPGYHARNLMSNQILSDYSTGAGLPATLAGYGRAVKAYLGHGDAKMNKYIAELKDSGVLGRMNIGEGVENLKPSVFGQGEGLLKKIIKSPQKFQQASEETAKLNVYSHFRNQGMSVERAAKKAEEAIFSPYRINQTEKGLVKGAIPFYSFTRQAVPLVAKTALKKGNTLTKYEKAKTAVEGLSPEGSGSPRPAPGTVRLPIKDKNGNYIYADPTYIIPHGNFDTSAGGQLPFGLGVNPLISEIASQAYNKDLYFNQDIAKSNVPERAKTQRLQHTFRTFAPNIMPTDFLGGIPSGQPGLKYKTTGGSKLYDAFTGQKDYAGRTRSKIQAILDTFGLKSSSVNPDQPKFDASARNKALRAIQTEITTTRKDQRLTPKEKVQIIQELNKARTQLFQH